jgi:hypothetical protein
MTATNTTPALNDALTLASMGLACFPCLPSKRPACQHGFHDAITDPTELRQLWSRSPGELIGVSTGEASGFDVLDIDAKHQEAFEWCKAYHEQLPRTRVQKTRSGGVHVLFRHAHGLRCSASRVARRRRTRKRWLCDLVAGHRIARIAGGTVGRLAPMAGRSTDVFAASTFGVFAASTFGFSHRSAGYTRTCKACSAGRFGA